MKKRIFSVILALCLVLGSILPAFAVDTNVLKFDENGEFKILHLCDCQDGFPAQESMMTYINYILKACDPDLVILGGDNTVAMKETKEQAIAELVKPLVDNEVYFTLVFGNHDHEQGVDNETNLKYYQKYGGKYCLAYDAVPELHGTANHNLPVYASDNSGKIKFNIWLLDSGSYVTDEEGNRLGYDSVNPDQIEWYKETYAALKEKNGADIPSMEFQHMVVAEIYEAMFPSVPFELSPITERYNNKNYPIICPDTSVFKGHLFEPPSPGYYNHGLFDAMVETGDVLATFSGHDHINSYEVEYQGIKIINTPGSAFRAYGNEFVRGSRLITINEESPEDFTSEVITVNELALSDSEYAEAADISQAKALMWVVLEKILLLLKNISAPGSALLYLLW